MNMITMDAGFKTFENLVKQLALDYPRGMAELSPCESFSWEQPIEAKISELEKINNNLKSTGICHGLVGSISQTKKAMVGEEGGGDVGDFKKHSFCCMNHLSRLPLKQII